MNEFLQGNTDYIYFIYGAGFIVLAAMAHTPRINEKKSGLPWSWLAGFASLHGLYEWLVPLSRVLPETPHPAAMPTLLAASFLFLLEFGRRLLKDPRRPWIYGPWWHLAAGIALLGTGRTASENVEAAIRLLIALPAGGMTAAGLWRAGAQASEARIGRLLKRMALLAGLYGLAAGLISSHPSPGWTLQISKTAWLQWTSISIEIVRLLLAVGLATCCWRYARLQMAPAQLALRHDAPLRIRTTGFGLFCAIVFTWFLIDFVDRVVQNNLRQSLRERAISVASMLEPSRLALLRAGRLDEAAGVLHEVETLLTRAQQSSADIKQLYLITRHAGKCMILATAQSPNGSPSLRPGAMDEAPLDPRFSHVFSEGVPFFTGPYSNAWGRWVAAIAPAGVDAGGGRVRVGLVAEMSAAAYELAIGRWRAAGIAIGVLLVLLILDFFMRHYRLWISALRLAEAEQRQRALSADLEKRVQQRTQELADANVSLRREIERHQEAEQKYRDLTDQLPAITYRVDLGPPPRTTFISPQVQDLLGISPEEWIADPERWLMQICEEDRERIRSEVAAHNRTGEPLNLEFRMRSRDGLTRWFRSGTRYQRDAEGRLVTAHGVMLDITEQIEAAQQLREAGERYRLLFEHSPAGLFHYDRQLRITELNDRFAVLLQQPRKQLAGADLAAYCDPSILPTLRAALEGGEGYHEGPRGFLSLGPDAWISLRTAPLYGSGGVITGGIAIVQDLSERRRIEEEHLRTQKLESLGLLAGGIAHDFNNILTAILGNISVARQCAPPRADLEEALQDAERAAQRARGLTHQLLTFAKGGAPMKQLHDINAVLREAAGFTVRGSASRCVYKLDPAAWMVEIDSGQIAQVVQNLIINADQAMPNGGVITIETRNRVLGENEIPRLPAGRYVEVRISDTGIGIPERLLGRIFDPYFTTKKRGSGLGLTMCFSILQKHGGHIVVDSEVGRGTTFTLFLPASDRPRPDARVESPASVPLKGSGRILVMDDERAILQLCRRILEKAGYEVLVADRGEEAIRLFDQEREAGNAIDLAILDITVPGGLGGRETLAQLRQRDPAFRAIVSSGYAQDEALAHFKQAGFVGAVPKPYRAEELLTAVQRALSSAMPQQ